MAGGELLRNFKSLEEFDFFCIQEHKLSAKKIPFVNKRLQMKKAF